MDTIRREPPPYSPVATGLHWASAILVAVLWLSGQLNGFLPRGPLRLGIWSSHIVLGASLGLVLLANLIGYRRLRPGPNGSRWPTLGVRAVLYGILVLIIGLGLWQAFLRGFNMFGLFNLPTAPGGKALTAKVNSWHALLADTLVLLASIYSIAALVRHYNKRGGALIGMVLRLRARS